MSTDTAYEMDELVSQMAASLGMPEDDLSVTDDQSGIAVMIDSARSASIAADAFGDEQQKRVLTRTLKLLEGLQEKSQTLTENVSGVVERILEDNPLSEISHPGESQDSVTDRLEWGLAAVSLWAKQQLPRSERRSTEHRFIVRWPDVRGECGWDGVNADPVCFADVLLDRLKTEGEFSTEAAAVLTDQLLWEIRENEFSLPNLFRDPGSDTEVTCFRLNPVKAQHSETEVSEEEHAEAEPVMILSDTVGAQWNFLVDEALDGSQNHVVAKLYDQIVWNAPVPEPKLPFKEVSGSVFREFIRRTADKCGSSQLVAAQIVCRAATMKHSAMLDLASPDRNALAYYNNLCALSNDVISNAVTADSVIPESQV